MQKNQNIALANIGMKRDVANDSLDEKSYTIAYNMNAENESGNLYKLKSEFSNLLASKLKPGFKLVGFGVEEVKNRTFVLLTNPTTKISEIGIILNVTNIEEQQDAISGCNDCDYDKVLGPTLESIDQTEHQEYVTLLEDSCSKCLNFNVKYPIKNIVIKTEKSGTKVFFSDGFNPARYFDESKLEIYKQTGSDICDTDTIEEVCVNCDRLRLFPQASPLTITPEELVLGGNLKLAQYTFYGAYSDSLGSELSEYVSITNPISVFDTNNRILTESEELERTNLAIKLSISTLDSQYDYYKIVVSMTNIADSGTRHFEVGRYPVTNNTVLFTTEQDKLEITLNDILIPQPNIKLLEGLTEVNNHLMGYGVTREKEWNLQPVVNLLGGFLKWQTHITTEDAYEDGINNALIQGYMRDEVYPKAIQFYTNTGYRTARFPLVARPATEVDIEEVNSEDLESLNGNITNCGGNSRLYRWQIYNTGSVLGRCALDETIPTNIIVQPVVKTTTVPLGSTGAGSFIIENPEDFTTLEDFINQQLEEGCIGFPFCSAADPTSVPDEAPEFEDCETPEHDPSEDVVQVVDISNPVLSENYIDFPEDYSRLRAQTYCSLYSRDENGDLMDDEETEEIFFPGTNSMRLRAYNFSNDKPKASIQLSPVDDPTQPLSILYFHDWKAAFESLYADNVVELTETGYSGVVDSIGSGYDGKLYEYTTNIHKKGLWYNVDLTENPESIFEITKGVKGTSTSDNVPITEKIRLSIFENTSGAQTALYSVIYDIRDGKSMKLKYNPVTESLEVEDDSNTVIINIANYRPGFSTKKLYFVLDNPIRRGDNIEQQDAAFIAPGRYCFGIALRNYEVETIAVGYSNISFQRSQRYTANCSFNVPLVNKCEVAPNEYGEFAYWESEESYPDNAELFDSSTLKIEVGDFSSTENESEFRSKYTSGLSQGRYTLNEGTDLTCKPIRHFKYPDNKVTAFMYQFPQAGFSKSIIYPIGATIDEELINDFLNIAVKNELITQDQRDSIIGYEIFRGDRTLDKGVVAKGLLYDMYSYTENSKDILFPNFPYNDLGENNLLMNAARDSFIDHPYNSTKNHNFTFHSPDTEYYNPTIPSDLKVEGYSFGKSRGVFEDVEDHPKYVILGNKAKALASKLATLEVIAEAAIIAAESSEVYRVQFGLANSINPVGIVLNIAAIALNVISSAVFKYGRYKYQWLQSFRDLGSPENFAKYYTSIGDYNYIQTLQTEGDMVRGIQKSTYLREGRAVIVNELGSEKLEINNVSRENSVFITLGSEYPLNYPIDYKDYDNKDVNKDLSSRFHESESLNCSKGRSIELERNIASPYVALKNYLPSQYGTIDSVDWISTSYKGDLTNPTTDCLKIYGGDTFITRHTLKRKTPFFLTTAMGQASKTPFNYRSYSNLGTQPRFFANFMSPDDVKFDRDFPNIETEYQFDCQINRDPFYIQPPSKFYLYYYGIPSFLTETTINTNYRTGKPEPKNLFWPLVGDYVDWTQEKNVSIKERNTYFYNSIYSSNTRVSIGRTLPSTYSKSVFDRLYDSPNGVVYSRSDNNENNLTEPWLTFRPMDKFDFDTSYGKLIDIKGIESGQVMARFESTTAIFNAFDTIVDDGATPETQSLGSGFRRRPVTFSETDLGYAGSQSSAMISNESGHFFPDAKRGQVFYVRPGANGMEEISANIGKNPSGMQNWFKEHLPFKVKNPMITNYMDIDVDNPYNGIGITMGWDSRYKRVFLTKKDYKPLKPMLYADKGFHIATGYEDVISEYESNGYTYEGIVDSNLKFTKEITGITPGADIYAVFDTTSMLVSDGVAAASALQTWYSNFQTANPTFTGSLYIIPYSNENYVQFPHRIKAGNINPTVAGGWENIAELPANLNTNNWIEPTEILLLAFVDETNPSYHESNVSSGFGLQPFSPYFQDFEQFKDHYENHYTFFKGALYPIVQSTTGQGGALVLQALAAMTGRVLTQAEIDATGTTVDVSLLLSENPYQGAVIPESDPTITLEPLENYGWTGFFDKVSPASAVFTGPQFQQDLNDLVSIGGSTTEVETVLVPLTEVELTDEEYFKEVSFTVAYNAKMGTWISYYDFTPNYYINHNNYFQTGINTTSDEDEFGLWSHLLTNKSFGVFYGKKYEIGFEFPFKNTYTSRTLESLEIWASGYRYHNNYDFAHHKDIMFNKLRVYNDREASGNIELVPQRTLSDFRRYPKTNGNTQQILTTNTNDRWNVNYIFNRVISEQWNQPITLWDDNQIRKEFNDDLVKFKGKKTLEPLRGHKFLVYLGYDKDSRFAMEFNWATNTEDLR